MSFALVLCSCSSAKRLVELIQQPWFDVSRLDLNSYRRFKDRYKRQDIPSVPS